MKRRVTRLQIETLLDKLRTWIPGIAIRTTFIAGAPGETDQQHQELVRFVRDFGFDMMGVFPFSPEPGTAMGRMPNQIPEDVKKARVEELMLTQQQVAFAKAKSMVRQSIEVLIDKAHGSSRGHSVQSWTARHQGQAPDIDSVVHVSGKNLHLGQLVTVQVTDYQAYDLVAKVPAKKSRSLSVLRA
jgi:ribosomal protein S12 methylthiotransferase